MIKDKATPVEEEVKAMVLYCRGMLLTSLDPDVLAVFGGHAHQEALPLCCLYLMQIVPRSPEDLVQERQRTSHISSIGSSIVRPALSLPFPHPRGPMGVPGGQKPQYHSLSLSAVGQKAPCAPPAPPVPHASSCWPETCWFLSRVVRVHKLSALLPELFGCQS